MATILVVEDNAANLKLSTLLLQRAGHVVVQARDAEAGMLAARQHAPDLILMDIQLPGIDGLAATALLKADPETATTPIVALTALAMKADEERSQSAGCDAYLAKPVRYKELYDLVDRLLGPDEVPS